MKNNKSIITCLRDNINSNCYEQFKFSMVFVKYKIRLHRFNAL